jgi:hypothetical protein
MSGPFDPQIVPDPAKVQMTSAGDFDVESAMRWGNSQGSPHFQAVHSPA